MNTDTIMTYRYDVFAEVAQPDWFIQAREMMTIHDMDLHAALSDVLNCCRRAEGIQGDGDLDAAVVHWVVPDNGGHFVEFCTQYDIVARVWIPRRIDWLPFRAKHVMPFLEAHAALAMANHIKLRNCPNSSDMCPPCTGNGVPPWARYARHGDGRHIERDTGFCRIHLNADRREAQERRQAMSTAPTMTAPPVTPVGQSPAAQAGH